MEKRVMRRSHRSVVLVAAGLAMVVMGLAEPAGASVPVATGSWPYPNGDIANTRDALGSTISSTNVSGLKEAWSFKLPGRAETAVGSLAANPIVQDGVVYLQDLDSNVYALSLVTGKLLWEYHVNQKVRSGPGPNGVAVAGGAVFGAAPTSVFALSATTGRVLWINRHLLTKGQGTFEIQPQAAGGRVYLASAYGSGPGGGILLALSSSTGKVLWKFNTVLGPNKGVAAGGVGAGGAWETPLVGTDGSVTFGIGNPYQSAASAIAHPSRLLYTDSDVNLDAATGKLRWYYQGVPNDFKDYDMQASPISTTINGAPAVLGSGKMGYVYAMNAETGQLIWKTPVGEHNGHDNDSLLALEHKSKLKAPYTILPGSLGGVLTNLALAGNSVYVATIDLAITSTSLRSVLGTEASKHRTGEIEAINLTTGQVEWDTKVPSLPLGAATVSNDLVFTTLFNGVLIALNTATGAIVYQHKLPTSTNAPIAVAGNTVLIPAGGLDNPHGGGHPQVVAYSVP
jgi:alcohol dehydrogenase (cytochrome c)